MKILIFGLVSILCMQTIHANETCQNKLGNLITDARKFLIDFKEEHDKDRARVKTIKEICKALIDYLNYYGGPTYGQNLNQQQLKTDIAAFIAGFIEQYIIASDIFTRLNNGIYILWNMAACLVAKYGLTCEEGSNLSGCDADYNAASCTLAPLISAVPGAVTQALGIVDALVEGADILEEQARELSSKYLLSCDACVGDSLQLVVVESFFSSFIQTHDEMHEKFVPLEELCDTIFNVINDVTTAFWQL